MTRNDGLQSWRARRRPGYLAPQEEEILKHDNEKRPGPSELERVIVVPSDKHGINVMLERALDQNPYWRERAVEAFSKEGATRAETLPKLRCLGATIVVEGKRHDAIEYMDDEGNLWPVKAARVAVRIEVQENESWKEHELASDLALTRESAFHPGKSWAIATPTCSLETDQLAELLMVAYRGPPECITRPSASQEAEQWAAATAIAKCALRGERGIAEAATNLIRRTLGQCLPLRLPKGAGLLVLAQAQEKGCGLFTVTTRETGEWWARGEAGKQARSNAARYKDTAFHGYEPMEIGVPIVDEKSIETIRKTEVGEPLEELGSRIGGRIVTLSENQEEARAHAVIWRIELYDKIEEAAHRLSAPEYELLTKIVNQRTVQTLAARNRTPEREKTIEETWAAARRE